MSRPLIRFGLLVSIRVAPARRSQLRVGRFTLTQSRYGWRALVSSRDGDTAVGLSGVSLLEAVRFLARTSTDARFAAVLAENARIIPDARRVRHHPA